MLPMSMMQAIFAPFLLALSFQRENFMDLEKLELSKSGLDKAHSTNSSPSKCQHQGLEH